jgi:NhaB family Na+:H+ antiporter
MPIDYAKAFWDSYLGHSPEWYKWLVLAFIAGNPLLLAIAGPLVARWAMMLDFIGTLMRALR